jgi:hypothetical protein
MAANNNIQISDLDFDSIKQNLKTFLRGQDTFKDYDFEGSGLSTLLDLMAYNTHYNAYYLNMMSNELFMDTAALRSSVVSHAKLLNYTPKSAVAPSAIINLTLNDVTDSSVTLPIFTRFISESVDGVNYPFVTKDIVTVNTVSGTATFNDLVIYQGQPVSLSYVYTALSNPQQLFSINDPNIDTSTLVVEVQQSSTNSTTVPYTLAKDMIGVSPSSTVYFLQEGLTGNYEIYFGDGVLGQALTDGNIVNITYLSSSGSSSISANNFSLVDTVPGNPVITPQTPSSNGADKESIDSIKFNAPKAYSSQGRAVTPEDYISVINQNNLGYTFDSVSVWSGADLTPPAFGQVFMSMKPSGGYVLTQTQKQKLIDLVIKPASVLTVVPTIVDPDYTYLRVTTNVVYDQKRTNLTSAQIENNVISSVQQFGTTTLNSFDSTFSLADLITYIQGADASLITNDTSIKIEKRFYPILDTTKNYTLNFGVPLKRSILSAGITSYPTIQYYSNDSNATLLENVYIEEVPFSSSGIQSISILNPGYNYTQTPTVMIEGDGSGATAVATVVNGYVRTVTITNTGNNYTQAIVSFVNDSADTTGTSASAVATIQGQYGNLRTFYYDSNNNNAKTILNPSIATIDYFNGIITFNNFNPHDINNDLGQLSIIASPDTNIITPSQNRILTIDPFDPLAVAVNVTAK